ncbi:MAG: SufD family Fe-S cluster assembly protein [Mycoplasmatales bacterium]
MLINLKDERQRKILKEIELSEIEIDLDNSSLDLFITTSKNLSLAINARLEKNSILNIHIASNNISKNKEVNINTINKDSSSKVNIQYYAIVQSEGKEVVNAISHINKKASKSEVIQNINMLLLDDASKGEGNPQLFIKNNDVIANHGASISQVDENVLYFMMSRGIPKTEAKRLIVETFLNPVLKLIEE